MDRDRSRLHSHQGVEEVALVDLVLQLLQLLVLLDAVVVHQDHFLLPHVEIVKAGPEETLLAQSRRIEVFVYCQLHLILKILRLLSGIRIFFFIVEYIIDEEVDLISVRYRCYCKPVVNLDLSLLIIPSSSKEHLDDHIERLIAVIGKISDLLCKFFQKLISQRSHCGVGSLYVWKVELSA